VVFAHRARTFNFHSLILPGGTPVKIIGIDFTSRPTRRKPITAIHCTFNGQKLSAETLEEWSSFSDFEHALVRQGPWIAGIDFPFGQSRRFIETIGWPRAWADYVRHAGSLGRAGFRTALNTYRAGRAVGDKEHRRATDAAAGAISPQKLYGVPVGLMFFEGARRLLHAGVTVPQLHDGDPDRVVVEAYPGVVARALVGRRSYKSDTKKKQTSNQLEVRHAIFEALHEESPTRYGFEIEADKRLCDDPGADQLDALLCAVQAAWAWKNKDHNFGAPVALDALEGWIADPGVTHVSENQC
jgi:hypothetical protein